MTTILPDCMMPDGADPCAGYRQLVEERDRLRAAIPIVEDGCVLVCLEDGELERLRLELDRVWDEVDRLLAQVTAQLSQMMRDVGRAESAEKEAGRLRELLREAHELFADDLDHLRKVPTCKGAVMLARIDAALKEQK